MAQVLMVKCSKSALSDKGYSPPLGILYLVAYAREQRPADVYRLVDLRLHSHPQEAIEAQCREWTPDVIGFSALTIEARNMHAMAAWCRSRFPRARIVVGGPHASSFGAQVLDDANIDYLVAGEGEIAFVRLLNALDAGQRYPELPSVAFKRPDGSRYCGAPNQELVDVEALPRPAWDLHDFSRYTDKRMSPIAVGPYGALFTSRGCPYRCTYCHSIFSKRYRALPAVRVVDDIEHLMRTYGLREFEIYDDTFNLRRDRVLAICDEIIRRQLDIRLLFPNGLRVDLLDETQILRLRQAGTINLMVAVESASPRIQKAIRKNNDLEKIRRNIRIAARAGIFTWGFFMMGFPGETRRELWRTARYAFTSELHGAFFFIVIPQAGTELARETGVDVGDYATITATDYFATRNTLAAVSHWELALWQLGTALFFYSHPRRLYRIVRDFPYSTRALLVKAFRGSVVFMGLSFLRNLFYRLFNALRPRGRAGREPSVAEAGTPAR